jgi:hypothetical protein
MTPKRLALWLLIAPLFTLVNRGVAQDSIPKKPKVNVELSGYIAGDFRYYFKEALYPGQHRSQISAVFQPEFYMDWNKGKQLLQFTGFGRLDQFDNKRTHADIRELYWQIIIKKWELSVGVKKIFWGVTESNHLVDIINQADGLEGFDLEQKLGQPMIHLSWSPKWGTIDFMAMTYFREMKFPGTEGRLRPPFNVNYNMTTYESSMKRYNPDLALRWSHYIGAFDIGVSHFYGTSRLPLFLAVDSATVRPHYETINQTGLDVQAEVGGMFFKGEVIHRRSKRKAITAFTVGGEYTFSNLFRSGIDLGLIAEYNWDNRGAESINAMDDDFFAGLRFAFNDRQSTSLFGGVIVDRNTETIRYVVEASRRLGKSWKVSLEAAGFENVAPSEFLYLIRNDSYAQVSLAKYF